MIDLHVHSTFSDGSLTPEELVQIASESGLSAMALTDHDCTDGIDRFLAACAKTVDGDNGGLVGIAGVELSADVDKGTMHILGYCMDHKDVAFQEALLKIREGRSDRNLKIVKRLNDLGLELTWDEVAAFAGEDVVGRPHFAMALIARGYVKTKQQAFDQYLANGKPGYVDRFRFSPSDSIDAILGAGGVPVLAHPSTLGLSSRDLRKLIGELKEQGLGGLEVYYSEHSPEVRRRYGKWAKEFGLLAVGGSDFHGALNPKINIGVGFGALNVPDEIAVELRRRGFNASRDPVGTVRDSQGK